MKFLYLFFAVACLGCSTGVGEQVDETTVAELNGEQLMKDQCYSCHNTQGTDNMLAPPMFRVKDHYWDEDVSREEFVDQIVEWVKNPTDEMSKMPGAKRKFGLMPKQEFNADEVKAIAEFMYDNDLESESCCSH